MDFYTAAALRTAKGCFTSSGFVQSITGVDNVCERAAVLAADGVLFIPKWARNGVTLAVALAPFAPDWSGKMMTVVLCMWWASARAVRSI